MRFVQFLQVLALLLVLAYLALVSLENQQLVRLPLPLNRGEGVVSVGVAAALFFGLGVLFSALLLLPVVFKQLWAKHSAVRGERLVQQRLNATLQAQLPHLTESRESL